MSHSSEPSSTHHKSWKVRPQNQDESSTSTSLKIQHSLVRLPLVIDYPMRRHFWSFTILEVGLSAYPESCLVTTKTAAMKFPGRTDEAERSEGNEGCPSVWLSQVWRSCYISSGLEIWRILFFNASLLAIKSCKPISRPLTRQKRKYPILFWSRTPSFSVRRTSIRPSRKRKTDHKNPRMRCQKASHVSLSKWEVQINSTRRVAVG